MLVFLCVPIYVPICVPHPSTLSINAANTMGQVRSTHLLASATVTGPFSLPCHSLRTAATSPASAAMSGHLLRLRVRALFVSTGEASLTFFFLSAPRLYSFFLLCQCAPPTLTHKTIMVGSSRVTTDYFGSV